MNNPNPSAKHCGALVIGGSAGSLDVVFSIVSKLETPRFPIIIVLHRKDDNENLLISLLAARTHFNVKEAEDKEPLLTGTIYIAPPDYHLLVEKDHSLSLDISEKLHYSRPSIDVCFETAAEAYGEQLVCLILSGANADGAAGLEKVKANGGMVLVQDPATAEVPYMPEKAMEKTSPDRIIAATDLPDFINTLK